MEFPVADLPLVGNDLAKAKLIKASMTTDSNGGEVSNKAVIDKLYLDIAEVYRKTNYNLELISEKRAKFHLNKIYTDYKELVRSGGSSTSPQMLDFQSRCEKLFDLIFCKCKIISCEEAGCEGCCDSSAHITCTCKREKKIPLVELAYVMDQRNREGGKGQFQMTDLDKKVTSKMQESQDRKAKDKKSSKPISSNNNHKDDQNNTDDMPPPSEVADIGDIQPVREGEQVQESFDDNDPEDSDFTPDFLLDRKKTRTKLRSCEAIYV